MIKQQLIDKSRYSIKCPYTMAPIGICIHNTANDATAANEISYMTRNDNQVSYHIAIDDKEAIQAIPFDRNAWHAGDGNGEGNRKYIGIEICYSKSGGERFVNAEKRAAAEVAALLKSFGWGVDRIKAHREFSGKNCPHRSNMTEFVWMVQQELAKLDKPAVPQWQLDAIDGVCGKHNLDINYWKPRVNQEITVGELFGILNKVL